MQWLWLANHPGDYVLSCAPQHRQDIGMRCVRIIVKEFDPPVTLTAHFSGGMQDDPLEHLPAFDSLDCSDQTMATLGITEPALAPLLFRREQALHRPEFHKLIRSE
jgi:hypothetical protein